MNELIKQKKYTQALLNEQDIQRRAEVLRGAFPLQEAVEDEPQD